MNEKEKAERARLDAAREELEKSHNSLYDNRTGGEFVIENGQRVPVDNKKRSPSGTTSVRTEE